MVKIAISIGLTLLDSFEDDTGHFEHEMRTELADALKMIGAT